MNFRFFKLLSIYCLFFLAHASADTVLLNNGEKYEGKVVYEDDTFCLLEVQVTKGIKDEKKFLKSDIKSISKQNPDIKEFAKLEKLVPTPELLGVEGYEARVKVVEEFIKEFSDSKMLLEAKKIHETLTSELEIVRAGGMKLHGKMVTAEDYFASAYAYDQLIAAEKINKAINSRDILKALKLFSEYESNFANGKNREELVPKIQQILSVYQANLKESLDSYDARLEAREAGLERMTLEDRHRTERAFEERMEKLKKRYDAERAARNSWVTPDAYLKESLVDANRQVEHEIKRLNAPSKDKLQLISLEDTYREAWEKLPSATEKEQKEIIGQLKRERMPTHYINMLLERVGEEQ